MQSDCVVSVDRMTVDEVMRLADEHAGESMLTREAVESAVRSLVERPVSCTWTYSSDDYSSWDTECEQAFCIESETPEKNDFKFCCYCGGRLVQVIPSDPLNEDDDE